MAFFIVTAILDLITTLSFMYKYGIHLEQNLIVRWLATTAGIIPAKREETKQEPGNTAGQTHINNLKNSTLRG